MQKIDLFLTPYSSLTKRPPHHEHSERVHVKHSLWMHPQKQPHCPKKVFALSVRFRLHKQLEGQLPVPVAFRDKPGAFLCNVADEHHRAQLTRHVQGGRPGAVHGIECVWNLVGQELERPEAEAVLAESVVEREPSSQGNNPWGFDPAGRRV